MKRALRDGITCVLVLASAPALAMYRCGNVFQDKPCDSGPEIRLSPSGRPSPNQGRAPAARPAAPAVAPAAAAAAPAPAAAPANFTAACARIGDQAQRIVWKREGGASQEQQLAERGTLSPSEQAKTVRDVYARRGTAPEIRAQIEAECVVEKQKEAEAAELLGRLRKQAGESGPAPAVTAAAPASAAASAQNQPATASNKPTAATCDRLRQRVDEANARLRQGGSAKSMEFMQSMRRESEASYRNAGCN